MHRAVRVGAVKRTAFMIASNEDEKASRRFGHDNQTLAGRDMSSVTETSERSGCQPRPVEQVFGHEGSVGALLSRGGSVLPGSAFRKPAANAEALDAGIRKNSRYRVRQEEHQTMQENAV